MGMERGRSLCPSCREGIRRYLVEGITAKVYVFTTFLL